MGHYIIEGQVIFAPEGQSITHIASEESTGLSVISTQILETLLEHRGHVVERDAIFTSIFDRHGAAGTNNNLNQYILNLRKQLHFYGIENEVIQTIPRIGFMVPVSVDIIFEEPIPKPEVLPAVSLLPYEPQSRKGIMLARLWMGAMVIVTLFIGFRLWQEDKDATTWDQFPQVDVIPLNDDKMCQIFLVPSGISYKKSDNLNQQDVLKHFDKLTCDVGINTRYYLFHSAFQENKYRNFVLKCTGDALHRPACFSRYVSVEQY